MVEERKDADDRMLESLLRAEAISDDGFSERIVRQIRRRMRLRQVALPAAAAVGAAISLKPLSILVLTLVGFFRALPVEFLSIDAGLIPSLPMIVLGGMLFAVLLLGLRMFEE